MTFAAAGTIILSPSANIICIGILFWSDLILSMFNCFYSLSRFCSDVCDLFICMFVAYFIKLFWILDLRSRYLHLPALSSKHCSASLCEIYQSIQSYFRHKHTAKIQNRNKLTAKDTIHKIALYLKRPKNEHKVKQAHL